MIHLNLSRGQSLSQKLGKLKGTGPYMSQKLLRDKNAFTELIMKISRHNFILKAWQNSTFFLDANSNNNTDKKNQVFDWCAREAYTAAILQYQENYPGCNAHVGKFQLCIEQRSDLENSSDSCKIPPKWEFG